MKQLVLVALTMFGICAVAPVALDAQAKKASPKAMMASGQVKSVSNTALTISSRGKDMAFVINGSTEFVGKGLGTKSEAKRGKVTATDLVGENDTVSVSYHDMGGTLNAARVRLLAKSPAAK